MARFYLGVGILLAFLVFGLWVGHTLEDIHTEIADTLTEAADMALSGDLEGAETVALSAKKRWEKSWHGSATVADHAPMDEIDGLLAQLPCYARSGNTGEFAACCTRCSLLVQAISEAHSLTWWNLL